MMKWLILLYNQENRIFVHEGLNNRIFLKKDS